jgi:putative FmdB family regulatory protein
MPTYEYRCKSCEHQFDIVQAFTDDALTVCPQCDGPLKKVFGNVGITFKGSGFYKTDSRSAGSFGSAKDADRTDAKKGAEADAKPKADTKADSSSGSSATSSSSDTKGSSSGSSGSSSSSSGSSSTSSGSSSTSPAKT